MNILFMQYDANGNLIYDEDRDISLIKYNVLNLPDTIQFRTGHQILNMYDAAGHKYKSIVYTNTSPAGSQYNAVAHYTYALDTVEWRITEYNGNAENYYTAQDTTWRVFNSIGYCENDTFYHYVKDHIGSNCAVVHSEMDTAVQITLYYASGVPMARSTNRAKQPYLYNGKEFIETHGLNEYDSQARMYYATIMRTTTMDPLAEKYYHISPYAWCNNDPVNKFDPDGRADYYAANGRHLCSDGVNDNKVYQQQNNVREANTYLLSGVEGIENTTASQNEGVVLGGYATPFSYVGEVDKISLLYEATMVDGKNQSEGDLIVSQHVGDKVFNQKFSAVSGNSTAYTLQNGEYSCSSFRYRSSSEANGGYYNNGYGFSICLNPLFTTMRTLLRIHPDGGDQGTLGCIGLTGGANELQQLVRTMTPFVPTDPQNTSVPLTVVVTGNPGCFKAADKTGPALFR